MGTKTPVSLLQEMMTRLGSPPKYDLIFDGSGTHTAIFKYKVYAHNVSAVGSGRSKKEAKHEAARRALEELASYQIEDVQPAGIPPEEVMTPYQDTIKENAIGALLDMCATKEIPIPVYKLIDETGAPHEKVFTFVCSVSKQKEIGVGRTKKQAKQLAAFNMMNRLRESLNDVLKDIQDPPEQDVAATLQTAAARYVAAVGTPRKKLRLNRTPSKYCYFSDTPEESTEAAWKLLSALEIDFQTVQGTEVDWMSELNTVLKCLNVKETIIAGKPLNNGQISVFLQVNLASDAVFFGTGADYDEAIQQAAASALSFLKINLQNEKSN